jgi:hypothetical protein
MHKNVSLAPLACTSDWSLAECKNGIRFLADKMMRPKRRLAIEAQYNDVILECYFIFDLAQAEKKRVCLSLT